MVVKTTTFLIFLAISILQLCSIKTLATLINPYKIPSCKYNPHIIRKDYSFPKCYADYKAAHGPAAANEYTKAIDALPLAMNVVLVARDNCSSVVAFFKIFQDNKNTSQTLVPCIESWTLAARLLDNVSTLGYLTGIVLSKHQVRVTADVVKDAANSVNELKCTMGYDPRKWGIVDEAKRAVNKALNATKNIPAYDDE